MISEKIRDALKKQHYEIFGHSGVQICRWTKKSLLDEGVCYKEKFYGIESHRCCQMSPHIFCQNKCLHCWRPIEMGRESVKKFDEPSEIIEECVKAQKRKLSGFGGNAKINMKKFKEAQEPEQFAISLIGEPTLYPKLAEFIFELRKRGKTSFLVTNGLMPEKILELKKKKALPTQIYVSMNASNKKDYEKWHRSSEKNCWKKFNQTLEIFSKLPTRTVIRMTLVKELNMKPEMIEEYAELIKKAEPMFVEVKGYMAVGFARKRLGYDMMPTHSQIRKFAEKIAERTSLKILDEKIESRVMVLGKDKREMKISNNLI